MESVRTVTGSGGSNPLLCARKEIIGLFARFFLQKNTSLFRPQFPFYRPNAKLAKQFRSVLSCEVVATKKNFVGNVLLLGFELSVKKVARGKFFSAGMKACIDPRRTTFKAEQIPLSTPRKKERLLTHSQDYMCRATADICDDF